MNSYAKQQDAQPLRTSRNWAVPKKNTSWLQNAQQHAYQQIEDGIREDEEKDKNNTPQIM